MVIFTATLLAATSLAQVHGVTTRSQEVSEVEGVPVLIKHLPDWQSVGPRATFATSSEQLRSALGPRPILDLIDFRAGTEAVTAAYPAGRLLIVEYATPQLSAEADGAFTGSLAANADGNTVYRRIGNYNVLVFDVSDQAAANALLDQVKYEKNVQWLGQDPFLFEKLERNFVVTTTDLFVSTVEVIVLGMLLSVIGGLIVGYVFFQIRERQRLSMKEFSDAGGMTRLNLDGLTPEIAANRLLND